MKKITALLLFILLFSFINIKAQPNFDNINPESIYFNSLPPSAAIYTSNYNNGYSYLYYDGLLNRGITAPSINNCLTGVLSDESELEVHNATMSGVGRGVVALDNKLSPITIQSNTITASESCVDLINNDNAPAIDVSVNNLTANNNDTQDANGMRIWENNNRINFPRFRVHCNVINMQSAATGIDMNGADEVSIKENSIYQNIPDIPQIAIHVAASNFCSFSTNGIRYVSTNPYVINDGFVFENSENNSIYNNTTNNTKNGFEFIGSCFRTNFRQNNMINHDKGLLLNELAIIDPQNDKGNAWYGNFNGGIAANNLNKNNFPQLVNLSEFFSNQGQGSEYYPTVDPPSWFNISPNFATLIYEQPDCKNSDPIGKFSIKNSDQFTLHGISLDTMFLIEEKTIAAKSLFEKFYLNDSTLNSSPDYQIFQDSLQLKASGKLSTVRLNLSKENQIIQNYSDLVSNNGIGVLLNQLDSISTQSMDTLIYYSLINKIYNNLDQVNSEFFEFNSTLNQYLDQQGITNNSILPDIIVNDNEKILNSIQVNHRLKGNTIYSSDEINNLTSIALQCPREGGASVYQARTKMYNVDRNLKYNNDITCNSISARIRKHNNILSNEYFILPDRLNNILKFTCKSDDEKSILIQVYELTGRKIIDKIINGDKNEWSLSFCQHKETIYLIRLTDSKSNQYNFKLIW